MSKICILGEDKRSEFLRKKYIDEGKILSHFSDSDFVVAPIPFTRDNVYVNTENIKIDELIFSMKKRGNSFLVTGALNVDTIEKLNKNGVKYIDIMSSESFLSKNSYATAEGTVKIIMENTEKVLKDEKILIIGYGRIAKDLTSLLSYFGANVKVVVRRKEALEEATKNKVDAGYISDITEIIENYNVIINTAPAIILNSNVLEKVSKDSLIIDVASKPGGVDFMRAEQLNLRVIWQLGIPSKYCPDSAATYIKDEVDEIISKNA